MVVPKLHARREIPPTVHTDSLPAEHISMDSWFSPRMSRLLLDTNTESAPLPLVPCAGERDRGRLAVGLPLLDGRALQLDLRVRLAALRLLPPPRDDQAGQADRHHSSPAEGVRSQTNCQVFDGEQETRHERSNFAFHLLSPSEAYSCPAVWMLTSICTCRRLLHSSLLKDAINILLFFRQGDVLVGLGCHAQDRTSSSRRFATLHHGENEPAQTTWNDH